MVELRKPTEDLRFCLHYNTQKGFTVGDIAHVLAEIPGANEEIDWHWIVYLKNKQYVYITGGCDNTGWDCQSSASSKFATTALKAAKLAPESEEDTGRQIREQLIAQIKGVQPYALYVG